MNTLARYEIRLSQLAGQVGTRNAGLLGLVSLGIMAGLGDGRILADVRAASGTPPLTDAEINRALATARRDTVPLNNRKPAPRWKPPPKQPPPLGAGARTYVQRMIDHGGGATPETLAARSPVALPPEPIEQTRLFLSALYAETDWLFNGVETHAGLPRLNVRPVAEWRSSLRPCGMHPHITANPLTGSAGLTKDGHTSYRCGACVAAYRYALVEFDALPLNDQACFWVGVIATGTLPLRSLTFSGGKSIHGLVEIGAPDNAAWSLATDKLLYAVANPYAAESHRADRACRNPDRLTRLAGATRPDKGTAQRLLWLASH